MSIVLSGFGILAALGVFGLLVSDRIDHLLSIGD